MNDNSRPTLPCPEPLLTETQTAESLGLKPQSLSVCQRDNHKRPSGAEITKMKQASLQLSEIRLDRGTQPRAAMDANVVTDYRERMEEGDQFPAVVVFFDGTCYWLADGFHRVQAAVAANFKDIKAEIRKGTVREARWYSFGANRANGKRRERGDIRRALEAILTDETWSRTPQTKIAEHVGCCQRYVSEIAANHRTTSKVEHDVVDVTDKRGRNYSMDTSNIGRTSAPANPPAITVATADTGEVTENAEVVEGATTVNPCGVGLDIARKAIALLETIPPNDPQRVQAIAMVADWIDNMQIATCPPAEPAEESQPGCRGETMA